MVVFEEENPVILGWQILQFIPRAGLKTFEPLVFPEFVPQFILSSILHLILKFKFILLPHMHLNSPLLLLNFIVLVFLNLKIRLRFPILRLVLHLLPFHLLIFPHFLLHLLLVDLKILYGSQKINILCLWLGERIQVLWHCLVLHQLLIALDVHRQFAPCSHRQYLYFLDLEIIHPRHVHQLVWVDATSLHET